MDIRKYMELGIIEAYCLGQLSFAQMREVEHIAQRHPEVKTEIAKTHAALRGLSTETPALRVRKENILHTLQQLNLERYMRLDQLPLLTPYSDYRQWLAVVSDLKPSIHLEDMNLHILQETPDVMQTLIWMKTAIEEDGHDPDSFRESFLVLEGECECDLGGKIVRLGAGGYVAIPPNTPHTIRNLQPGKTLLAVIQRYRIAA